MQHFRPLGAQSAPAAARRLLGPLARAQVLDAAGRQQGLTSVVEFYGAVLPAWLPAFWQGRATARGLRQWGTLGFIRKQFTAGEEELILRILFLGAAPRQASSLPPVPLLLGLGPGWVFMEDLQGSGGRFNATDLAPGCLAAAMVRLQAYLAQAELRSGLAMPAHQVLRNPRRLRGLIRRTSGEQPNQSPLLHRVHRLAAALQEFPQQPSHNDIGPGNMAAFQATGAECDIRFIDFGSARRNVIGADLHHYAVWGLNSPEQGHFFDALACRFAELGGHPLAVVRAGAYGYAIERTVMRWWRRKERRSIPARTHGYRERLEELLRRAEAELVQALQG